MVERTFRVLFLLICISVAMAQVSRKESTKNDRKSKKVNNKDGRFTKFEIFEVSNSNGDKEVFENVPHHPPKKINPPISLYTGLPAVYVFDFQKPEILEELDEIKRDGLRSIQNGIGDIASYFGGKVGYILGSSGGHTIGSIAGGIKGFQNGANNGAIVGANAAAAHFQKRGSNRRNKKGVNSVGTRLTRRTRRRPN